MCATQVALGSLSGKRFRFMEPVLYLSIPSGVGSRLVGFREREFSPIVVLILALAARRYSHHAPGLTCVLSCTRRLSAYGIGLGNRDA